MSRHEIQVDEQCAPTPQNRPACLLEQSRWKRERVLFREEHSGILLHFKKRINYAICYVDGCGVYHAE